MSTRIYNGFRFSSCDFGEMDAAIRGFRAELKPLHLRELARLYGSLALIRLDGDAALPLHHSAPPAEGPMAAPAREWAKIIQAVRDYVDRFGPPDAQSVADRVSNVLALRGPLDPDLATPAIPSTAALAFLREAASMDPGLLPALDANHGGPLATAWAQVADRQRQIERSRYRDPQVDFDFDIDLFSHGGRLYGIVRSERQAWIDLWMARKDVEEFGYWDCSDPPSGISEKAWKQREAIWDAIMPSGIPARSCWTASLVDKLQDIGLDDLHLVLDELPSFTERVDRVARGICLNNRFRELAEAAPPAIWSSVPMFEVAEWARGPEGQAAMQDLRDMVTPLLKAELTVDDLLNGVPTPEVAEAAPRCPG